MVHLSERECSIQRRFQKILEEALSPIVTPKLREKLGSIAIKIAKNLEYVNVLTVEFIHSNSSGQFYFNEVNTRLRV